MTLGRSFPIRSPEPRVGGGADLGSFRASSSSAFWSWDGAGAVRSSASAEDLTWQLFPSCSVDGWEAAPWEEQGREVGAGLCGGCSLFHLCFLASRVGVITPMSRGCRGEHMRPCAVGLRPRGQHSAGDSGFGDDGDGDSGYGDGGDDGDSHDGDGDGGDVISDADADAFLSGRFLLPAWSSHEPRSDTLPPRDAWAQCSGPSLTLPGFYFRTSTGYRRRSTCSSRRPATPSWSACTPASRRPAGKSELPLLALARLT